MAETQVSIRIDLETGGRIGAGKIALFKSWADGEGDKHADIRVLGVVGVEQK